MTTIKLSENMEIEIDDAGNAVLRDRHTRLLLTRDETRSMHRALNLVQDSFADPELKGNVE